MTHKKMPNTPTPTQIFLPLSVKEHKPETIGLCTLTGSAHFINVVVWFDGNVFKSTQYDKKDYDNSVMGHTHFLQPCERYVFTKEQLEAYRKEGAGAADERLITPEILEEFGFSYMKVEGISRLLGEFDEPEEGDTHNWTVNVKQSKYCDSFRFELVKWGEQSYFTFSHQWLRVRIQYVHQLTKLYSALTGLELKQTK